MSELLALSFDADASPAITLKTLTQRQAELDLAYGWGFGWYPGSENVAVVIKDPKSSGDDAMTRVLRDWERFRSSIFLCHIRGKAKRISQGDAQPFIRSHAGRHWLLAHSGDLSADLPAAFPLGPRPAFEPVGRTDSEFLLCWILGALHREGLRSFGELGSEKLHDWLHRMDHLGQTNLLLSDGLDLIVHCDAAGRQPLHWIRRTPPHATTRLESRDLVLELGSPQDPYRSMWIASTEPLSAEDWRPFARGQTMVVRRGKVVWDSHPVGSRGCAAPGERPPAGPAPVTHRVSDGQQATPQPQSSAQPARRERRSPDARVLSLVHETTYRYTEPVERSTHRLRLRPVSDERQQVLSYELDVSVDGVRRDFEDVFGNRSTLLEVSTPFSELAIHSRATVRLLREDPLHVRSPVQRDTIPLVWMPWQRQMMLPYLLPPELPETELRELNDFAMSFVRRNDHDLLESLLEINRTIYNDFAYVSGSTTLETTPFQVYTSRRGVCQDFANLLICMARLLNVPARYRMGYISTGADDRNRIQSDASHAWVEIYLPWIGWHGLDPTNGCQVNLDHIRVACGRNFRDATPTSGTIYKGGGLETLVLGVRVEEIQG
jgi:transglutaminase-like putative cysteine protease/predicted glutamine amidotransferase